MSTMIFKNIGHLMGVYATSPPVRKGDRFKEISIIEDAWLAIENEKFLAFGKMEDLDAKLSEKFSHVNQIIDVEGRSILPTFCDSHTHIVYAGSREQEFVYKIKGMSYEEIAAKGGGILNSAKRLQSASEEELVHSAQKRIDEIIKMGTGAVEIKSGYGLTTADEIKMLRVIKKLKSQNNITIKSTFLGAHAIPVEYKSDRKKYIEEITEQMLPKVAEEQLADYCDVFCDKGFFTVEETDTILTKATALGLKPKIHANELDYSGGIQVGVKHKAISVDHLEFTGEAEIKALLSSDTIATLLPGTAFYLKLEYPPARKMIDAGVPVALASDYNPGSSPSGNMFFVMSLASIQMKMLPEEVINATTINGAYAMELDETHGTITPGKEASFIVTEKIPSPAYLMYAYGRPNIEEVYIKGQRAHPAT